MTPVAETGGRIMDRAVADVAIELDKPFEYAGVSMVVEPWQVKI